MRRQFRKDDDSTGFDMEGLRKILEEMDMESKVTVREFTLNLSDVKGFYVHKGSEMKSFGADIVGADIVSATLDNDQINAMIQKTKKFLEGKDIPALQFAAASSVLTSILALHRMTYLIDEAGINGTDKP